MSRMVRPLRPDPEKTFKDYASDHFLITLVCVSGVAAPPELLSLAQKLFGSLSSTVTDIPGNNDWLRQQTATDIPNLSCKLILTTEP